MEESPDEYFVREAARIAERKQRRQANLERFADSRNITVADIDEYVRIRYNVNSTLTYYVDDELEVIVYRTITSLPWMVPVQVAPGRWEVLGWEYWD